MKKKVGSMFAFRLSEVAGASNLSAQSYDQKSGTWKDNGAGPVAGDWHVCGSATCTVSSNGVTVTSQDPIWDNC